MIELETDNRLSKLPVEIRLRLDIMYLSRLLMDLGLIEDWEDLFQEAANYSLYNHTKIEEYIKQDYENRKYINDLEQEANSDASSHFEFDDELNAKCKEWAINFSKTLNFVDDNGNPVDSKGNPIKTVEVGEVDESKFADFFKKGEEEDNQ